MKLATADREKRTTAEERRAAKANRLKARQRFIRARKAEKQFQRNLLQVARQVGSIVSGMSIKGVVTSMPQLSVALARYSELIRPWAKAVSAKMVAEVDQRDENAWTEMGKEIGRNLRLEVKKAPTGARMQQLMDEQVDLITSLPIDAAKRVHKLTIEAMNDGTRASEIAKEIERSGQVTASRARLIARTETSRTVTAMTQSRAEYIGSDGYIWRTVLDSDVRHLHQELEGKFIRWDDPPVAGEGGERAHAGSIYNCFLGDTKFSLNNGVRNIMKSPYSGEIIELSAGSEKFSLTPNHPILTTRGWIPAGMINIGDDLIQMVDDTFDIIEQNENNSIPTFHEFFETFSSNLQTHQGIMFDFYGDVPNGDVDVISVDHFLSNNLMSDAFQCIRDFAFPETNSRVVNFVVVGSNSHIIESLCARLFDQINPFFGREFANSDFVGIASASSGNTSTIQYSSDGSSIGIVFDRDCQLTNSGLIIKNDVAFRQIISNIVRERHSSGNYDSSSPDLLAKKVGMHVDCSGSILKSGSIQYKSLRVVDKRFRNFLGHVFTIESDNGWYGVTTASIIAKNCRCYAEPVIPDKV